MDRDILSLFTSQSASIALKKDGAIVYSHYGRGIAPALELYDHHPEVLHGADVFDLIVGKAAASIFILGGAKSVSALTISEAAANLLIQYHIPCSWQEKTKEIINRQGTGLCPFEQAVLSAQSAEECLPLIRSTLQFLRNKA